MGVCGAVVANELVNQSLPEGIMIPSLAPISRLELVDQTLTLHQDETIAQMGIVQIDFEASAFTVSGSLAISLPEQYPEGIFWTRWNGVNYCSDNLGQRYLSVSRSEGMGIGRHDFTIRFWPNVSHSAKRLTVGTSNLILDVFRMVPDPSEAHIATDPPTIVNTVEFGELLYEVSIHEIL
jgi:hypothetical protein